VRSAHLDSPSAIDTLSARPMALRVLYLTDSLSELDGVGRYTLELLRALGAERPDFEPRLLLARKHRPTSSGVPRSWPVCVALPPDYFFYMSPARFWPSLALATLRVARAARGADLVHAIKDYPHNLVGLLGARLAGKPCVATAHGTYSVQPLADARHARLARWTYQRLAALIAVSGYTRRRLEELAGPEILPPERQWTIPNAVDAAGLVHAAAAAGRPHLPCGPKPYTLTIGELKERKGHHLALAAFARVARRLPDLQHVIVGKLARDAYTADLEARIAAAGLVGRVHFLGNVSEEHKLALLRDARALLHTPVRAADGGFEGFGIVYLEAAALGVPSIGTLDSGAEDAIVDGVTGLLVEPDEQAAGDALARLLTDEPLRRALGAGGREHAAASSWSANAGVVLELYERVLAERR